MTLIPSFLLATRWWMFDFSQPNYLFLLVLLIPIIYIWRTSMVPASRARKWVSLALRVVLVLGLVLALAGTRIVWKDKGLCVAFVIDQSQSIPGQLRDNVRSRIREIVERMEKDDQFVVVEFGGDAVLASLPSLKGPVPEPAKVLDAGHTDIARALRLAMATFPADRQKRVVLFSDGNQNIGDSIREARIASANDVDVHTVLTGGGGEHEVMIDQVILPPRVQKDVRFAVRVVVTADQPQSARLVITRDGRPLPEQQVQLKAGANIFDIPDKVSDGGFHDYQVTIQPEGGPKADTFSANNTAFGFVRAEGPGKVMVVRGNIGARDYITDALLEARISTEPGSPAILPSDIRGLMGYDCVVLQNVGKQYLTPLQIDALEKWVKDFGGGLVMIGGDDSFGPGGYKGTALERISPVDMDIKRKKHLASVALAVMLDKSGSMGAPVGTLTKMNLANQGAVESIKLLTEADEAAIAAVDTEVKWMIDPPRLLPMNDVNKATISGNTLSVVSGGGGIYTKTALEHAYKALASPSVNAMVRHVIVFADTQDTEQQEDCLDMAAKALHRTPSITTSVIGLGVMTDPHVEFQKQLAKTGGGRWYITDDAMNLPRIFSKEAFIASRNAFIEKKEGIVPTLYESPLLDGFRDRGVPRVYGYIGTTLKSRATLAAHGVEPDDPLLAHWVIGLGKVVAYTSDTGTRWGKDWTSWDSFARFWLQTIRWAGRSVNNQQLTTTTTIDGNEGHVVVEAVGADGKPINNQRLEARIAPPGSNEANQKITMIQVAPGKYEGRFTPRDRGTYMVNVIDQNSSAAVDISGATLSYPPEFRDLSPNTGLMKRIAEVTGGQVVLASNLANIWQPKPIPVTTFWPLWDVLIVIAAAGLLLDVAWRRLNILDWFTRQRGAVSLAGAGHALGALKVIRSGREQVEQQRETLRQRVEIPGDSGNMSAAPSPQADSAVAVMEEPERPVAPAAEEPQPADYRGKLLAAKRRAEQQIRDAQKKK